MSGQFLPPHAAENIAYQVMAPGFTGQMPMRCLLHSGPPYRRVQSRRGQIEIAATVGEKFSQQAHRGAISNRVNAA